MKRVICVLMVVGTSVLVFASSAPTQTPPSQSPPPGPGSEWTQEDWNNTPPMPNGGIQFGSPMRGPQLVPGRAQMQQQMQDMQSRMQQMQAQAQANRDDSIRQALGATDAQWTQIKPRLDRINQLKAEVNASIEPGGTLSTGPGLTGSATSGGTWGGGGFAFSRQSGPNGTRYQSWSSTPSGGSGEPTKTGSLCQELNNLLQNPSVPAGQVSQKIAAIRQAREQAQRDLTRERKELRPLLNFRQQATLLAMGYLD